MANTSILKRRQLRAAEAKRDKLMELIAKSRQTLASTRADIKHIRRSKGNA